MAMRVIMFVGSVRENRMASRVAAYMKNRLETLSNHDVSIFDPMEMPFELLKQPLHFYRDQGQAPQWLKDANEKIVNADAFVIISPEYNCTIPPALTNMMDHFPPKSYAFRPTAIVCYSPGSLGGVRAAVALRPFLAELGAMALPHNMIIPKVGDMLNADGSPKDDSINGRSEKIIKHLDFYASAVKRQKEESGFPA